MTEAAESGEGRESTRTVVIAFCANLLVALAKSVVAAITGSASMLAESAHSWADTGNQVLLFVADRKSSRPPDDAHPFGYGREAYVWSMFAAMGLFTAGAVVSVWHGVSQLSQHGESTSPIWAYVVLAVSFVFEGVSFSQAYRQTHREADKFDRDVLEHALATSDPTLRAVFAEDSAALVGLVLAGLGVFLHQVTGSAVYDAIGSILVGVLLGVVALVLINRNRQFLTGQQGDLRLRALMLDRIKDLPGVARVTYIRLEFLGPRQLLVVASVDLSGDYPESRVAYALRDLEHRLEEDQEVIEAVVTLATEEEPSL
jgi:cation diffusion facilitator family transporter